MASTAWFANSAELSLGGVAVAAIKNVTFTPQYEHVPLYGMESVKRKAIAKHSFKVEVKCKYAMWDPAADRFLMGYLAGRDLTITSTAGVDDSATYRNKVATFTITATVSDFEAASKVTLVAASVYFESLSFELNENEWITRDMTGYGEDLAVTYASVT